METHTPYSHYVSGICETPNGNTFVACTGLRHAPDGARVEILPQGVSSIALKEVSPDEDAVFHVRDAAAAPDRGRNAFRPEHLPRSRATGCAEPPPVRQVLRAPSRSENSKYRSRARTATGPA